MGVLQTMPASAAEDDGAPTPVAERIHALDALRGVALLGIVWANVRQLLQPWDIGNLPVALASSEQLAWLDWQVFDALIDFKFITLFSLLFGMGFALQGERLAARGSHFSAIYLRRVGVLALFGLAHGVLLYPAEVLLPYAIAGALLLALRRLSPANMLRIGMVLIGFTLVWTYELGSTGRLHVAITAATLVALIGAAVLSRWSWRLALVAWLVIVVAAAWGLTVVFDVSAMAAGAAHEYREAQRLLAAIVAGAWFLRTTPLGRAVYATGSSPEVGSSQSSPARAAPGRTSFACARKADLATCWRCTRSSTRSSCSTSCSPCCGVRSVCS